MFYISETIKLSQCLKKYTKLKNTNPEAETI